MIAGTLILEDMALTFACVTGPDDALRVTFTVADAATGQSETRTVPQADFLAALSIAVHNDGMPDANRDYPAAESVMGAIRWIP